MAIHDVASFWYDGPCPSHQNISRLQSIEWESAFTQARSLVNPTWDTVRSNAPAEYLICIRSKHVERGQDARFDVKRDDC